MPTQTDERAPTEVTEREESHCHVSCCEVNLVLLYSSFQLMEKERGTVNEQVYFKVNV